MRYTNLFNFNTCVTLTYINWKNYVSLIVNKSMNLEVIERLFGLLETTPDIPILRTHSPPVINVGASRWCFINKILTYNYRHDHIRIFAWHWYLGLTQYKHHTLTYRKFASFRHFMKSSQTLYLTMSRVPTPVKTTVGQETVIGFVAQSSTVKNDLIKWLWKVNSLRCGQGYQIAITTPWSAENINKTNVYI